VALTARPIRSGRSGCQKKPKKCRAPAGSPL
jgi:hypothetical protein